MAASRDSGTVDLEQVRRVGGQDARTNPAPTLEPAPRSGGGDPSAVRDAQFGLAKFRPATLPSTLVERSPLSDQLTSGADARLTVVVASAGAGKSVLLGSWSQSRDPSLTSWLSCDEADADPVRF